MDSTKLRTRLTHAARRLPTTACAIRLASARIPQVTSTILPSPPLVTILPPPLPCAVSPTSPPFILHQHLTLDSCLLLVALNFAFCALYFQLSTFLSPQSRIPVHDELVHQIWHLRMAWPDRRRLHLCQHPPGHHGHRRTRKNQIEKAHDFSRLRHAFLLRRIFPARRGHFEAPRNSHAALRNLHAHARSGLRNHAPQTRWRHQLHRQSQPCAISRPEIFLRRRWPRTAGSHQGHRSAGCRARRERRCSAATARRLELRPRRKSQ